MRPFARKRSASPPAAAAREDIVQRLDRLEAMVEGLQDALYRESHRQDEQMDVLRDRTRPEHMAKALSDDARRRGL
jgi:hypothetical protein